MASNEFKRKYSKLVRHFKKIAEGEESIFLPNIPPNDQVDYVLIAMEPSLGRWNPSKNEDEQKRVAEDKIREGFHNFIYSIEDFILHYAIRQYLCKNKRQTYHLTDLSKGAMLVSKANEDRAGRYARWYKSLLDEMKLIKKTNTRYFAIGKAVKIFLDKQNFPYETKYLIHYSSQAASARNKAVENEKHAFNKFKKTVCLEDILQTAHQTLYSIEMSEDLRMSTINRLKKATLSESRLKLLFAYKKLLEET